MRAYCSACNMDSDMFDMPLAAGDTLPKVYCGVCFAVYERDNVSPVDAFGTGVTYYDGRLERPVGSREELAEADEAL